jgi:hypothetical protein
VWAHSFTGKNAKNTSGVSGVGGAGGVCCAWLFGPAGILASLPISSSVRQWRVIFGKDWLSKRTVLARHKVLRFPGLKIETWGTQSLMEDEDVNHQPTRRFR